MPKKFSKAELLSLVPSAYDIFKSIMPPINASMPKVYLADGRNFLRVQKEILSDIGYPDKELPAEDAITEYIHGEKNSLPEIEQNRVGKYLKNLVRIQKATVSLDFADRQVKRELNKQHIEPYTEAEEIKCSFCGKSSNEVEQMIVASDDICICNECVGLCSEVLQEEMDKK